MKKVSSVVLFSFFLLLLSCGQRDKKQAPAAGPETDSTKPPVPESFLLTDSSWGALPVSADIEAVKKTFGAAQVKDERICGPECVDSFDVTTVYPGSDKTFTIYWEDSFYHKKIMLIRCYATGAPYHTADGLKIGSTLRDALKVNGKPIAFMGFGWDYGGTVFSLNHGKLESGGVRFNLDLDETAQGSDNGLYGDTELNSEMPQVQKHLDHIRIKELSIAPGRN